MVKSASQLEGSPGVGGRFDQRGFLRRKSTYEETLSCGITRSHQRARGNQDPLRASRVRITAWQPEPTGREPRIGHATARAVEGTSASTDVRAEVPPAARHGASVRGSVWGNSHWALVIGPFRWLAGI